MQGEVERMSKNNRKKVYKNSANAPRSSALEKVMITIVIIGVIFLIFTTTIFPRIKKKVANVAAQKTVEMITENAEKVADSNPEVAHILESLTEEDKETVTEIISEHMDTETVTEVMGYVSDGDKDALIDYAQENLSPEEIANLMQIYGKYAE